MTHVRKNTAELAAYLIDHPHIAAFVFKKNAAGVSTHDLPYIANEYISAYTNEHIPSFTNHLIRKLLHRERPFDHPNIYIEVDEEDAKKVQAKFRKTIKEGRKRPAKKPTLTARDKFELGMAVFKARAEYERAMRKAAEAGLDEQALETLSILFDEECLGNGHA